VAAPAPASRGARTDDNEDEDAPSGTAAYLYRLDAQAGPLDLEHAIAAIHATLLATARAHASVVDMYERLTKAIDGGGDLDTLLATLGE
jgi:hypothetical protein